MYPCRRTCVLLKRHGRHRLMHILHLAPLLSVKHAIGSTVTQSYIYHSNALKATKTLPSAELRSIPNHSLLIKDFSC